LIHHILEISLYPHCAIYLTKIISFYDINEFNNQNYLIYGSLPNFINISPLECEDYLNDYINTTISKDVLEIAGTRKSTQVYLLAKLLALQIDQLININELAINIEFS